MPTSDELYPTQPPQPPAEEVRIEDLESAQPLQGEQQIALGADFDPEITDLPKDGPGVRIVDGVIQIDRETLAAEMDDLTNWLKAGVSSGDEKVLQVYLRNLPDADEEEVAALRQRLEEAFRTRNIDPLQLDELHVNIVSAGIAERNLIREGLRPDLLRQPFHFRDKDENVLRGDEDLDIVIARSDSSGSEFKLIVGSKQGIAVIAIPSELPADKFKPDLAKLIRDKDSDVVRIPLAKAGDGTKPMVGTIEIHRGPVDLLDVLARQEKAEARRRQQEREAFDAAQQARYTPPPSRPTPGGWTAYSG